MEPPTAAGPRNPAAADRRDRIGAAAAAVGVVSLLFIPAAWSPLENFDPPKALTWAALLAWLAARGLRRPSVISAGAGAWGALLLAAWVGLRGLLAGSPGLPVWMNWAAPVLLLLAGMAGLAGSSRPIRAVWAWAAAGQAALMAAQWAGWDPLFGDTTSTLATRGARMIGTIGYHNQAALFVALGGLCAVSVLRHPAARARAAAAAFAIVSATGCRSVTVGLLLALGATAMVLVPAEARRRRRLALAALAAGVLVAALSPSMAGRWQLLVLRAGRSADLYSRVLMARVALGLWREHPLAGAGPGAYALEYVPRLGAVVPAAKDHPVLAACVMAREAHHDYLQFLAEFGLPGFLLAAAVGIAAVRRARTRAAADPPAAALAAGAALVLAVDAGFAFPWQSAHAGPAAALLLGALLAEAPAEPARFPRLWRIVALGVLVPAALVLLAGRGVENQVNIRLPAILASPHVARRDPPRPATDRALALLGAAVAQAGDRPRGLAMMERAREHFCDITLLNNLGRTYLDESRNEDAAGAYRTWADSGIRHRDALGNLAAALERAGRPGEAADVLLRRRTLWPDEPFGADLRLGTLLVQAHRPDEAIRLFPALAVARETRLWPVEGITAANGQCFGTFHLSSVPLPLGRTTTVRELRLPADPKLLLVGLSLLGPTGIADVSLEASPDLPLFTDEPGREGFDRYGRRIPASFRPPDGVLHVREDGQTRQWRLARRPDGSIGAVVCAGQTIRVNREAWEVCLLGFVIHDWPGRAGLMHVSTEAGDLLLPYKFTEPFEPRILAAPRAKGGAEQALNVLGAAWQLKGRDDLARLHWEAALEIAPAYETARRNLEASRRRP